MKKSPFTFLTVLGLLILTAITLVWVRSYLSTDTLAWQSDRYTAEMHNTTQCSLASANGDIRFIFQRAQSRILDRRLDTILYKLGPNGEITGVEVPKKPYPPPDHAGYTFNTSPAPVTTPMQRAKETFAGFSLQHHDALDTDDTSVSFPIWLLFALAMLPPLRSIERFFRAPKQTSHTIGDAFAT